MLKKLGTRKGFLALGVVAIAGMSALVAEQFVIEKAKLQIEERLAGFSEKMAMPVAHVLGDVSVGFQGIRPVAVVSDLQVMVGETGELVIDTKKLSHGVFDEQTEVEGIAVVTSAAGGAFKMLSVDALKLSAPADAGEGSSSPQFTSLAVKSLSINSHILKSVAQGEVLQLMQSVLEGGVDLELSYVQTGSDVAASLDLAVNEQVRASLGLSYSVEDMGHTKEVLDPDTAEVLVPSSKIPNKYTLSQFDLQVADKGVLDTVYSWGAGFSEVPSLDDAENFKKMLVESIDNHILSKPEHMLLPEKSMVAFGEWLNKGGVFSTSVKFADPVPMAVFWQQLFGYAQPDFYKGAEIKAGVIE